MNIYSERTEPLIALAPMDGVTDRAFRRTVRSVSPHVILYSEFTKVANVGREADNRLGFTKSDLPYVVQLIGNEPEEFRREIGVLEESGVSAVDLNMGCPSRKIANSQHGSALMRDSDRACRIIEACKSACSLPISIKTRLGWHNADDLIPFVKKLETAGLDAVIVHGRTYSMKFDGVADWEPIYELKKNVSIPVIGNGDVMNYNDGLKKIGCLDGFMIGRAAYGNPWVFLPQDEREKIGPDEKIERLRFHMEQIISWKPGQLYEVRKHLPGYLRDFPEKKTLLRHLYKLSDPNQIVEILQNTLGKTV